MLEGVHRILLVGAHGALLEGLPLVLNEGEVGSLRSLPVLLYHVLTKGFSGVLVVREFSATLAHSATFALLALAETEILLYFPGAERR